MVTKKERYFGRIEEVKQHLLQHDFKSKSIAIIGGYYIIDFDNIDDVFIPLIHQDIDPNKPVYQAAQTEAKDFPSETFNCSVDLHKFFKGTGLDSRIMLIVNDHKTSFLRANRKMEYLPKLRNQYYVDNKLPKQYVKTLSENNLQVSETLLSHSNTFNKSTSYLFSETYYRRRFDRGLKTMLLKHDGFNAVKGKSGKREIIFEYKTGLYCNLNKYGQCGCNGEVMSFIYSLVTQYDFKDIILFVPAECSDEVHQGINAIVSYFCINNIYLNIQIVSNLPYENYIFKAPKEISVIEISSKPD